MWGYIDSGDSEWAQDAAPGPHPDEVVPAAMRLDGSLMEESRDSEGPFEFQ